MKNLILENWIFIATGIFLAVLGILIQKFKLHNLIAGYNTLSPAEKEKINIARVAKTMRNALLGIAAIWIIVPMLSDLFDGNISLKIILVITGHVGITVWLLLFINRHDKFKISS